MKGYIKIVLKGLITIIVSNLNLSAQCITSYPYFEGFEAAPTYTAAGTNSDWAWGTPAHPTINTAGGGSKSWCVGGLTGTFYNLSEQSTLSSPCFDFTTLNYPWISLKIFWEDEYKWDGLVLQSSINNGISWQNVGAFGDPVDCNTANWYTFNNITWLNSLPAAQRQGWSGRIGPTVGSCTGGNGSGGWVTAKHCLVGLANQPNVKFRFVFGSGTTCNNYDGIALDDITISDGISHAPTFTVNCNNFTAINPPCPVVSSYTWNFGDPSSGAANTSAIANPTHIFSAPGIYSVTLSVSGGQCNPPASITKTISISNFASAPISQNVTCNGGSNGSATVTPIGAGPFSYTWSPSGGNNSVANGLSAGNYTVQITDANNCFGSSTVAVTQPAALTGAVSSNSITCNGFSNGIANILVVGGTPGYSYNWTPSGGTASAANGLGAGTYTVIVKDLNNCIHTETVAINQPPALTASITFSNALCGMTNGSATVTAGGGTPGYALSWIPSGVTSSAVSGLAAGNYSVIVKDANNCSKTSTINIIQQSSLNPSIQSASVSCNGGANGSATVTPVGGTAPYTYNWIPTGGTSAAANNLIAGGYTVTVNDANNCNQIISVNITEPAPLIANVNGITLCDGQTGTISGSAVGGILPYNFIWNGTPGGNVFTFSSSVTTIYTLTVTDANGCSSLKDTALINVLSPLSVFVTPADTICPGDSKTLTANASGGNGNYSYLWLPSNAISSAITVTSSVTQNYTVIVSDGCSLPNAQANTAIVIASVPFSTIVADKNKGCAPLCVSFTCQTSPGFSVNWSMGEGSYINGSVNSKGCYNSAGIYTITSSVVDNNGCQNIAANFTVQIYPKPVADFNYSPYKPIIDQDADVHFTDASFGANVTGWNWYFMNNASAVSNQQNPVYVYQDAGEYVIALVVKSDHDCADTILKSIVVGDDFGIWVPTAFTVNEDGLNDLFYAKGYGVTKFEMNIFDRWGERVFTSHDIHEGWDGSYQNRGKEFIKEDTYVWKIKVTNVFEKTKEFTGRVTLLK